MRNKKGQVKEALGEGLLELILTLLCFGFGALVIGAFGVDFESVDSDLLVLLGLAALGVIGVGVFALIKFIRKRR
ncbi:MAG: hypothetical protein IIX96_04655 [Clostridia bacterium]|nr:hypothetical protein [Clostridia bacterium]